MTASWTLRGDLLIACSCDWGCPCNFNAPPSRGFCEGGWCWSIDDGRVGDARLDGLSMSLWAKWPGAIHEGGGTAVAFIDDRADDAQQEAMRRLLRGELGGPWGIFINTYALTGPEPARHEIVPADHRTRVRIGDAVRLELTPITNPVSGADAHPEVVLPEGLVVKRAALAASDHFSIRHGDLDYDHSGRYTAFGRFDYAGA